MPTPNIVDLSKYQTKAINGSMDIDFADLKANGIKAVIIQLGHGVTQDPAAESFIAKANAVGLIVHGYHFFESGHANQVQFSITNAQQLGLSKNAYYFLDMEGNISGDWSDQFRPFYRNWKMNGWNVGLYASLSKYSLFNLDEFKINHVYKWVADWDVAQAPGVADIWQYNCSTGLGQYANKLDKDVDITGNLIKPIDSPKPIVTDPNGTFKVQAGAFVNFDYSTTDIQGGKMLVASPDGVNKIPKLYPDGTFGFIDKDYDHIWEGIKDRIKLPTINNKIQWTDVLNKPDLVTEDYLKQQLSNITVGSVDWKNIKNKPEVATVSQIPSLEGYAKLTDIPSVSGLVKEAELDNYIKQSDLPNLDLKGYVKITDLVNYAKQSDIPHSMTWEQITGKPNVATQDDISYLKTLIGSSSSGDAGLSIEAIVTLIKHHLKADVNAQTGNLEIEVDDVSNGSIADAVATKVAQSLKFEMQGNQLVAEIGGTE